RRTARPGRLRRDDEVRARLGGRPLRVDHRCPWSCQVREAGRPPSAAQALRPCRLRRLGCPYLEYCLVDTPLRWGVTKQPLRPTEGVIDATALSGPGFGIELDRHFMEEFTISERVTS